ncbi:MAG: efflux RND transporter permease subunit [Desulfarculaceae bacterium]
MNRPGYLNRPWGLLALFTALVLGGLFCWPRLPVELLPRLPFPRLTVVTNFENATPQDVDTLITRRLEAVLGTVPGVRRVESVSSEGSSSIKLIFDWGSPLTEAAAQVREKLDSVADQLPREADTPLVLHFDPSEAPVITLALAGGEDLLALRSLAEDHIKTKLETQPGVAAVRLSGGLVREVQVLADRGRLVAQNLDLATVVDKVKKANLDSPAGELHLRGLEVAVRTVGRFHRPQEITQVPLSGGQGQALLTLGEVADVVLTHKDKTGFSRVDGKPAVLIAVIKGPLANAVQVSRTVREQAGQLKGSLPPGWGLSVVEDQAPFIEESLGQLGNMVLWGGGLAFLVLIVFLRSIASALLVVVSAPVALVATFGLMHVAGVSLNLMSIGGLALGVGMLVDGSIVVLEAFRRHRLTKSDSLAAAQAALTEVRGGLVCGALTTTVVLVPILFMTGLAQRLFKDFAFTLAASLLLSMVTALFLLPTLLTWLYRNRMPRSEASALPRQKPRIYAPLLERALRWRLITVFLSVAVVGFSAWGLGSLGASLLPDLSGGRILVQVSLPPGSSLERLEQAVSQAEAILAKTPEVKTMVTRAGVDPQGALLPGTEVGRPYQALIALQLKPGTQTAPGGKGLMERLRQELAQVKDAAIEVAPGGDLAAPGRESFAPPQLLLVQGEELGTLRRVGEKILSRLRGLEGLAGLRADGVSLTKQLMVVPDRQGAAVSGVSVSQVARSVRRAVQGEEAGKLLQGDRQTDIRVRLRPGDRRNLADLEKLPLSTPRGGMMYLGQLARVRAGMGPEEIFRYQRRQAILVRGQVTGQPFSTGQDAALKEAAQVELPPGYELQPGAQRVALTESLTGLAAALGLALLLIYVILVVRFESLRWPLVILMGLPPLMAGPALALHLAGIPISALVLLGGVVLLGMAVNGSILMVEYCNQLRQADLPARQALSQAAWVRFKPLMMSTLTTVLGALPLCLGLGGASAISRPLALTVVSGLLTALLSTLFLVPVLYSLWGRLGPGRRS